MPNAQRVFVFPMGTFVYEWHNSNIQRQLPSSSDAGDAPAEGHASIFSMIFVVSPIDGWVFGRC